NARHQVHGTRLGGDVQESVNGRVVIGLLARCSRRQLIVAFDLERCGSVRVELAFVRPFSLDSLQLSGAAAEAPRAFTGDRLVVLDGTVPLELNKGLVAAGEDRHTHAVIA